MKTLILLSNAKVNYDIVAPLMAFYSVNWEDGTLGNALVVISDTWEERKNKVDGERTERFESGYYQINSMQDDNKS